MNNPVACSSSQAVRGLLAGLALVVLPGCVGLHSYDPRNTHAPQAPLDPPDLIRFVDETSPALPRRSLDAADEAFLAEPFIIEFDDEGDFWTPASTAGQPADSRRISQFERARAALRLAKGANRPVSLLFFVHGWKHDASDREGSNLNDFRNVIRRLNETDDTPRLYLGVYIAWRGASWNPFRAPPDRQGLLTSANQIPLTLSYWDRANATDRVARASVSYAMLALAAEAKRTDLPLAAGTHRHAQRDYVVMVGHSMGGRILERAVAQAMVGGLTLRLPDIARERARLAEALAANANDQLAARKNQHTEETQFALLLARRQTREAALAAAEKALDDAKAARDLAASGQTGVISRIGQLFRRWFGPASDTMEPPPSLDLQIQRLRDRIAQEDAAVRAYVANPADAKAPPDPVTPARLEDLRQLRDELEAAVIERAKADTRIDAARLAVTVAEEQLRQAQASLAADTTGLAEAETRLEGLRETVARLSFERVELHDRGRRLFARPADLIVLLNPATNSVLSRQLREALSDPWVRACLRPTDATPVATEYHAPWIVSVSSPGDTPNARVFPIASNLSRLFGRFRNDEASPDQRHFVTTTGPLNDRFRTHVIEKFVPPDDRTAPPPPALPDASANFIAINQDPRQLTRFIDPRHGDPSQLVVTDEAVYRLRSGTKLSDARLGEATPTTTPAEPSPYWAILADASLIQNHNDVFSPRAQALTASLLRMFLPRDPPTVEIADAAAPLAATTP